LISETQVSISSSTNLVTIGDRINVKLILKTSIRAQKVNFISKGKDFEIISEKLLPSKIQGDYILFEKNITISFFKTGDFNIGPFIVELIKNGEIIETKQTNSVPIRVKSVLTKEDKFIKPLKDLIEIKGNPFCVLKYVIAFFVFAILVVLIIFLLRRRKRYFTLKQELILSPIEELELRVNELIEQKMFEKGRIKRFFTDLTIIIKHFLSREYKFSAEDFTTYETLLYLKAKEKEALIVDDLEFLFNVSDLVKFAKFVPESNTFTTTCNKIRDIIISFKKRVIIEDIAQNVTH
jgi:hypothetical protein